MIGNGRSWCLLLLVACGGSGNAATDGALVDSGSGSGSTIGEVAIIQASDGGSGDVTLAAAGFAIDDTKPVTTNEGPCQVELSTPGAQTPENAGTVTITSGSAGIVLTPDGSDDYTQYEVAGDQFAAGDNLTISAPGSDYEGFQFELPFPGKANVTSTLPTSLSLSAGFSVTWTPLTGDVHVILTHYAAASSIAIDCTFAGSSGTGAIPGAALASLDGASGVDLSVVTETLGTVSGSASASVTTFTAGWTSVIGSATLTP
jgi:hypothetical protein